MAEGYEPQPMGKRQITGVTLDSNYINSVGATAASYYVVSGLAVISFNFNVTSAIPGGTHIISGLPKPDSEYCCVITNTGGQSHRFTIKSEGELRCNDAINDLAWFNGLAVYPIAD